jgi:hypothetical protein
VAVDAPVHDSGVSSIDYRYWNSSYGWSSWITYGSVFTLGVDEGVYYLEFNATDNLGNVESVNNWTIWVDDSAPNSSINNQTAGYYSYFQNSTLPITATINISSETNGHPYSGLKNVTLYYWYNNATNNDSKIPANWSTAIIFENSTSFSVWSGNLWNVSWSFDFTNGPGYYRFCSMAYDNVSNHETLKLLNRTNNTECFYGNNLPNSSTIISPSNGANGVGITTDLRWSGSDSDSNDTLTYDVYFGTSNPPHKVASNQSSESYDTGTMSYITTYYWQIVTWDDHGASTPGSIWSFTTMTGGGGGGPPPPLPPSNAAPNADANGPYSGYIDISILFDGSDSTDPDGSIVGYRWDFENDGTYDTSWLSTSTTTHIYIDVGTYTTKLEVKDNYGLTDTDTATVTVNESSRELYTPVSDANGPYVKLTFQNIIFDGSGSYDTDGTIENYTWNFGDETTGYGIEPVHSYNTSGIFTITLTVTDNDGLMDVNTTTANIILDSDGDGWDDEIEQSYGTDPQNELDTPPDFDDDGIPDEDSSDGKYIGDTDDDNDALSDVIEDLLGSNSKNKADIITIEIEGKTCYLLDIDNDGLVDTFYDHDTETTTLIEIRSDGIYKLDINGNGKWDKIYNPVMSRVSEYKEKKPDEGLPWIMIVIAIVIVVIIIIGLLFKIGYLYIEREYED